jgi:hypothetical protein
MLAIPTHVALAVDDPELLRARAVLSARLHAMTTEGEKAAQGGEYLVSTPFRDDDGAVAYVHVFRAKIGNGLVGLGVRAAPGWWPLGKRSLAPRRSTRRATLRLVS